MNYQETLKGYLEARSKRDTPQEGNHTTPPLETSQNGANSLSGGSPKDAVHYQGSIQPIEIMARVMTKEEFKGFLKGNAIKYAYRAGRKQGESAEKDTEKFNVYSKWLHSLEAYGTIELPDKTIEVWD